MIIDDLATRILGVAALLSACGCGSEASRPPVPPLAASPARVPPAPPPASLPDDPPVRLVEIADPPAPPRLYFQYGEPLRAPGVETGDPELDPLVSSLKVSYAEEIKDGRRLVIMDMTDPDELTLGRPYQGLEDELLREASDQVPAEMIRDFCEKNRKPRAIWPELTRYLPATLLSAREREAIFSTPADDV